MEKMRVKEIKLNRVEGHPLETKKTHIAHSFFEADGILYSMSKTCSKTCYDKVDFTIVYEDDTEYFGKYDLYHFSRQMPNLSLHIKQFLNYMANNTDIELREKSEVAKRFLKHYDLGV